MADAIIRMKDVNKWYGEFHVLRNINLEVARGERIVICGPSGSGKSTMIRCINRLEEHQQGTIEVDGIELTNDLRNIEAIRRDVGMVFQHFNLFPHLTVLENLTLGPIWVLKKPRAEAEATAMKFLERVRIPEQANKYPGQLSGGQQQRVFLARALVSKPDLLVLDEPTVGIDAQTQADFFELIFHMHAHHHMTFLMVSHDIGMIEGKLGQEPRKQCGAIKFYVRHSHEQDCAIPDLQHSLV